jgi:hypothetical protein
MAAPVAPSSSESWQPTRYVATHICFQRSHTCTRTLTPALSRVQVLYDIYFSPHSGEETESRRNIFFTASRKAWETGVVEVLQTLEDEVVGPYALGDHVVRLIPSLSALPRPCVRITDDLAPSLPSHLPIFTASLG